MQLFRFGNPDFLYFLLLIPVFTVLFVLNAVRKKRALRRFGNTSLVSTLIPEMSSSRPVIKFILQILAYTACIFVLARPQFGSRIQNVKKGRSGSYNCSRRQQLHDG